MRTHTLRLFFITWLLFLIPACAFLLMHNKGDFSLLMNKEHTMFADIFFTYFTHMGGIETTLCITFVLLLVRYQLAIVFLLNSIAVFLVITALKEMFQINRPVVFFQENSEIYYVPGVTMLADYSFPSGHSSNAFCMGLTLSYMIKNKLVQILLCLAAIFVALSRIYLMQHFLIDVVAGSAIAVIITTLLMRCFSRRTKLLSNTTSSPQLNARE